MLLCSIATWQWPWLWLVVVPAAMPLASASPWTGWLAAQEFDLVVLATAAGGYLRRAQVRGGSGKEGNSSAVWWFAGALVIATLLALERGLGDAGRLRWDLFGDYTHAMNSLRIAKGPLLAVLVLPLLAGAFRDDPTKAVNRLIVGLVAGLALVTTIVTWERLVYPGLLDFSYVYRVTATFWEMHVGGAAIDGFLALTIPFAAWGMLEGRSRARWLASAALAIVVGYAVLMTFSRGVYFAAPFSLVVLAGLRARQRAWSGERLSARARLAVGATMVVVVHVAFSLAGYAGAGVVIALALSAMALNSRRASPWWPSSLRTQGGIAVSLLLITEAVAVVNGGSLLLERFQSTEGDFGGRWAHWQRGVDLLSGPDDWLRGKGMGRMPAQYAAHNGVEEFPAEFVLSGVGGREGAALFAPRTRRELSGLFGMSQRIPALPQTTYALTLEVWNVVAATLQVSLCEKHLLYPVACLDGSAKVVPTGGWQRVTVELGGQLQAGPWYAHRQGVLAINVLEAGRAVVVDDLRLDAGGHQWLENGNFSAGLARWFLDGMRYFQPWHIDNAWLEALLDGGLLLAGTLAVLWAATLWRVVFGPARYHVLAPILAAALSGYFAIGMFASQLDAPRVSFLYFVLLFSAWLLPAPGYRAGASAAATSSSGNYGIIQSNTV